jgi:hypothetical protein
MIERLEFYSNYTDLVRPLVSEPEDSTLLSPKHGNGYIAG